MADNDLQFSMQKHKIVHRSGEERPKDRRKCKGKYLVKFNELPEYLRSNPFIHSGYRQELNTTMCLKSIFWWTNETINIWSHVLGCILFFVLAVYDFIFYSRYINVWDKMFLGFALLCYQVCLISSAAFHTFSCRGKDQHYMYLKFDLCGINLSILAMFLTGIYFAFGCHTELQMWYLFTVLVIFFFAAALQIPQLNIQMHIQQIVMVLWVTYGILPTIHWTFIMGGLDNPTVKLLLPRVLTLYGIMIIAFIIYILKIPERFISGKVDYIGSSHQWWHIFVVIAMYHWHNTGIEFLEFRSANLSCNGKLLGFHH